MTTMLVVSHLTAVSCTNDPLPATAIFLGQSVTQTLITTRETSFINLVDVTTALLCTATGFDAMHQAFGIAAMPSLDLSVSAPPAWPMVPEAQNQKKSTCPTLKILRTMDELTADNTRAVREIMVSRFVAILPMFVLLTA